MKETVIPHGSSGKETGFGMDMHSSCIIPVKDSGVKVSSGEHLRQCRSRQGHKIGGVQKKLALRVSQF